MRAVNAKRAQDPVALALGGLTIVLPTPERRLTGRQWTDLACAIVLDFDGLPEPAQLVVSDVERRLGVNDAHHRAVATSAGRVRRDISSAQAKRRAAADGRARRLAAADRAPPPTEEIERLVRRAGEAEAKARELRASLAGRRPSREVGRAIKDHQEEAKRLRALAAEGRRDQLDRHWAEAAVSESVNYALLRKDEVVEEEAVRARFETDEAGALRRHRRHARPAGIAFPGHHAGDAVLIEERVVRRRRRSADGLQAAYEAGDLDEGRGAKRERLLLETGRAYRDAYARIPGLSGGRPEPTGGSAVATKRLDAPMGQEVVADQNRMFAEMRAALSRRQRAVLDLICGQSESLSAAATRMRAGVPSVRRALRGGLAAAAEAAREWRNATKERSDATA